MTENRNRRKKRPAYDQAKDAQRRRSANAVRSQNSSHPITNPNFDPDAPRPSRYTERSVDYGSSYPDNSIQFPTGGRPAQNQNRNQTAIRTAARRMAEIRMGGPGSAPAAAGTPPAPARAGTPSRGGIPSGSAPPRRTCGTPPAGRAKRSGSSPGRCCAAAASSGG